HTDVKQPRQPETAYDGISFIDLTVGKQVPTNQKLSQYFRRRRQALKLGADLRPGRPDSDAGEDDVLRQKQGLLLNYREPAERLLFHRNAEPGHIVSQIDGAVYRARLAVEDVPEQLVADLDVDRREILGHRRVEARHDHVKVMHLSGMRHHGDAVRLGECRNLPCLCQAAHAVGVELDVVKGPRVQQVTEFI